MKLLLFAVVVVAAILALAMVIYGRGDRIMEMKSALIPSLHKKVTIHNVEFSAEIADTDAKRKRGLSGRQSLGEHQAMLFVFAAPGVYPFWMKNMHFPIDIIWIRSGKIIGISKNLEPAGRIVPPIHYPPSAVDHVLEVRAGIADRYFMAIGDTVDLK